MAEEIQINESSTLMVSGAAIATFESSTPKQPVNRELKEHNMERMALWGEDNDLPQQIITQLKANPDLISLLDIQARVLYDGGVTYDVVNANTGEVMENKRIPEVDAFLKRNWMYPIQACNDFYRFFNIIPQFTVTNNRKNIKWLVARQANWCRYSLQDEQGKVNRCFVNPNFPDAKKDDKHTISLPTINPILDAAEDVKERKDGPHYIYGLSYPTGETYYSIPNWWSIKKSKWLDLANKIPAFKLALMKNQITIKYQIDFPSTHWEFRFPDWKKMSAKEKKAAKEAEIKTITTYLQGEENAGKSLTTSYQIDPHTAKEFGGVRITPIDDKIKDGIYLEDSVEATIKIFTALGLDPSILGIVPGKGGSNRAGSDKREAINIYKNLITPHAHIVLKPYDFVADYNGWNTESERVEFRFKSMMLQTLDAVTPGMRETLPEED